MPQHAPGQHRSGSTGQKFTVTAKLRVDSLDLGLSTEVNVNAITRPNKISPKNEPFFGPLLL